MNIEWDFGHTKKEKATKETTTSTTTTTTEIVPVESGEDHLNSTPDSNDNNEIRSIKEENFPKEK